MDPHPTRLALACLLVLAASPAFPQGQLHKCVDAKGKVSYQDFPCGQAPRIGAPEAPASAKANPAADGAPSPVMRQLDAAVRAAIAARDLPRAKGLAVTAEHWEWIAEAEKTQPACPPPAARRPTCAPRKAPARNAATPGGATSSSRAPPKPSRKRSN